MPDLVGSTLASRYRVDELLGRGGMAEVYKAWDNWRHYFVALKVLRDDLAEDVEFVRRFQHEADALARLAHDHVVRFYALEQTDDLAFIVMAYVAGTTLRKVISLAKGPLPPEQVLQIIGPLTDALDYAHHEGIIHHT